MGAAVLVEDATAAAVEGPVTAGSTGEAVHEQSRSLEVALDPVTEAARTTVDQLRKTHSDEITVEFGVDPTVEAGALITEDRVFTGHEKVMVSWKRAGPCGRP
ncbi:CU044_2847 family protein [Streptomyces sp. NPDC007369]|uniref:CU044_2847 family protein n=1 Tax=Streptomyces sp. NPDC007369 TaxID=3154589 RepID=UPI0033EE507B